MTPDRFEERIARTGAGIKHGTTLSSAARSRMRAELSAFADLHTAHTPPARVRSPFFSLRSLKGAYAMLAALLIVVVSGGTAAYASEDTLPGDALYPVKVGLAEPVQGLFIPDTKGKAEWHAVLAERRIEEGTTLLASGRLDSATEQALTKAVDVQVSAATSDANELSATGKPGDALAVSSDLEARLAAHAAVLDTVARSLGSSTAATSTQTSGTAFVALVHERSRAVRDARLALENASPASVARAGSPSVEVAIAEQASTHAPTAATMTGAPVIQERAQEAHAALAKAQSALASGEPATATREARASVRLSQEASILMKYKTLLALPEATTTATSTEEATTTSSGNPIASSSPASADAAE